MSCERIIGRNSCDTRLSGPSVSDVRIFFGQSDSCRRRSHITIHCYSVMLHKQHRNSVNSGRKKRTHKSSGKSTFVSKLCILTDFSSGLSSHANLQLPPPPPCGRPCLNDIFWDNVNSCTEGNSFKSQDIFRLEIN